MRLFAALLLAAMVSMPAAAAIVPNPVLAPDGQQVDDASPGLGQKVWANPGYQYRVWWNDNLGRGDYDFNDLVVQIDFTSPFNEGFVTGIIAANAAFVNVMFDPADLIPLGNNFGVITAFAFGTFAPGTEVILPLRSGFPGVGTVYTGPASRNADGEIHAWVEVTGVPEPSTYALVGLGLVGLWAWGRRRRVTR